MEISWPLFFKRIIQEATAVTAARGRTQVLPGLWWTMSPQFHCRILYLDFPVRVCSVPVVLRGSVCSHWDCPRHYFPNILIHHHYPSALCQYCVLLGWSWIHGNLFCSTLVLKTCQAVCLFQEHLDAFWTRCIIQSANSTTVSVKTKPFVVQSKVPAFYPGRMSQHETSLRFLYVRLGIAIKEQYIRMGLHSATLIHLNHLQEQRATLFSFFLN